MKLFNKIGLGALSLVGATSVFAQATPPDYSTLTSAVDFAQIITVLLGVAATIVAFILVKNNMGAIMSFVRGKAK